MIKGFLRVASRAVAIQLEEAAAATASSQPYVPGRSSKRNAEASGSGTSGSGWRRESVKEGEEAGDVESGRVGDAGLDEAWVRRGQVFRQPGPQVGLLGGRSDRPRKAVLVPGKQGRSESADPQLSAITPDAPLEILSPRPLNPTRPAILADQDTTPPIPELNDLSTNITFDQPDSKNSSPSSYREKDRHHLIKSDDSQLEPSIDITTTTSTKPTLDTEEVIIEQEAQAQLEFKSNPPSLPESENPLVNTPVEKEQLAAEKRSAEEGSKQGSGTILGTGAGVESGRSLSDTEWDAPESVEERAGPTVDLSAEELSATSSASISVQSTSNDPSPKTLSPTTFSELDTDIEVESVSDADPDPPLPTPTLRPSRVPSSRLGRLFHYGSLVAGLGMGAATEYVRRSTGGGGGGTGGGESVFMSEANVRRLVDKLGKMRGAALKLGQFMSIQDTNVLPEQLERVLQQVQAQANYMPDWQMDKVMRTELGPQWEDSFSSFDRIPIASASIGQVHRGTLSSSGLTVATKIQFPGIQESISSDLDNLSLLLRTSALLPRGLYLDNTLKVMRGELGDECDYIKEAENGRRMKEFLKDEDFFEVPMVVEELTTGKVLTTEMMSGKPLSQIKGFSQELRDKIGSAVLRLCLLELFRFRLMQTDPNWANFLYDKRKDKLQLIDFGATREYSVAFMDQWYRLLKAVIDGDREAMREQSQAVGYLTGEENEDMVNAHLRSMELLAVPFLAEEYDFSKQSVTDEVRTLIPTMLKHRLTPPPNETYSLNRKLSGSFLLCAKLGSKVRCRDMWEEVVAPYKVST